MDIRRVNGGYLFNPCMLRVHEQLYRPWIIVLSTYNVYSPWIIRSIHGQK